jgi:ribosomal protein L16 Arg81 hydroxylase
LNKTTQTRPPQESGLAWLIHPLAQKSFQADYWERSHLVIERDDPAYYENLLSLDALDQVLATSNLRTANLRVVRSGQETPVSKIITNEPGSSHAAIDRLYAMYRDGATIVFNSLHEHWEPLTRLCRSLADDFSCPTQVNVYLTPAGNQGFNAHYDTHDVFVAQIHGSKRWRVYAPPVELPLREQPHRPSPDGPGELLAEVEMTPGTLLYLPRGYKHEASANEEASAHLTIGIMPITWSSILIHTLRNIALTDVRFRRALPPGFASDPDIAEQARQRGKELLAELHEQLSATPIVDQAASIGRQFRKADLRGHLTDLEALRSVDLGTRMKCRPGVRWLLTAQPDAIRVEFHGKVVSFPRHVENEVRFSLESPEFSPGDIPGSLDQSGRLVLSRTLLREGLLTIA